MRSIQPASVRSQSGDKPPSTARTTCSQRTALTRSPAAAASCAKPSDRATARSCRAISTIRRPAIKPRPERRVLPLEHRDQDPAPSQPTPHQAAPHAPRAEHPHQPPAAPQRSSHQTRWPHHPEPGNCLAASTAQPFPSHYVERANPPKDDPTTSLTDQHNPRIDRRQQDQQKPAQRHRPRPRTERQPESARQQDPESEATLSDSKSRQPLPATGSRGLPCGMTVQLCPTACPTGLEVPVAKPSSAGIIIRVSGVRVPPLALRQGRGPLASTAVSGLDSAERRQLVGGPLRTAQMRAFVSNGTPALPPCTVGAR